MQKGDRQQPTPDGVLQSIPLYRALSAADREGLAAVSRLEIYPKGAELFAQGEPAEVFFTIVRGRVKVSKLTPSGNEVILEIFGPGDPVGAVAVYGEVPYPATAAALEPTLCLKTPKRDFFALLETRPSLVRGLLLALTQRVMALTARLSERSEGTAETRFARFFLKLERKLGRQDPEGTVIPLALTRRELAGLMGTTVETSIRIMSRWRKMGIVRTEENGFRLLDRAALESLAND